ncbi:uncharacterized protein LOC111636656 isoform X2 [Centruroides sculpturatus]|uniref:uncharacterized protein LOC111636656 isoform X2 n=1 Tax=Centruroides sculpturatus TaxID=218467 RepID=UPI000C6DFE94|nr:uncharacterized protein LOC111636656 isoform X2 [Centruroides sculpturatus]
MDIKDEQSEVILYSYLDCDDQEVCNERKDVDDDHNDANVKQDVKTHEAAHGQKILRITKTSDEVSKKPYKSIELKTQAVKKLLNNEYENDFEKLRWIMNYLLSEKLEKVLRISVVKNLTYNQMLKCIKPCLCYLIFMDFGRYYVREIKKFKFPKLGFSSQSNEDVIETFYSSIINYVVPVLKLMKASKINKSLNRLQLCVFLKAGSL